MRTLAFIFSLITLSIPLLSQEAYTIQESNTGLRNVLYNPLTESKAEELQEAFDLPSSMSSFRVFGTDIDPLLGFTNKEEGIQLAYALSKSLAQDSADHFLLLFKEKPTDESIATNAFRYRIQIQWPEIQTYDTLSGIIKESIRKELESSINELVNVNSIFFSGNAFAEAACIDLFIEKIRQIKIEGLSIDESALVNAGFVEVPIDDADIENTSTLDINAYDYAGLKEGDDFLKDNFIEAAQEVASLFTISNIITDNDAIASGLFNSANTEFGLLSSDIVAWYHYFESTGGNKLYCKSRNTISLEESRAYIDTLFKQLMIELNVNVEDPPITFSSIYSVARSGNPCIDLLSWSAKICLLDKASQLSFLVGGSEYNWGVMCGVIDGFYKTVIFIYDMSEGITQLSKHVPFTGEWCVDLVVKVWNRENFKNYGFGGVWQGMKDKWNSDKNYFQGLYASIASIVNSYQLFFSEAYAELKKYFNDITFQNGTTEAGYAAGQAVFEVIIFALTGGTSSVSQLSKISTQSLTKLKSAFNGANFGDFLSHSKNLLSNKLAWAKCKLLLTGCFVKNTPILMAGKRTIEAHAFASSMALLPVVSPIQDIKPDDIVKSYRHEQSYYATADNKKVEFVSGWQSYDYLDITPETWQIGTFEITEADGDIVNIEANRPKTWYQENNVYAIGGKAYFYMPEIGINGNATLLYIRPTTINTTHFALNESGLVDRPVISTFKRNAPEVFDYHFSDGSVIGATPDHPFFSVDRNDYISVGELQLGEQVMTAGEKVVKFIAGKQRNKGEPVYNLEVWREHNYYVGSKESGEFLLVHNTCWGGTFTYGSKIQKAIDHIWDFHSYTNRKPGVKSYFESVYSTPAKIKTLVQDAIARGAKDMVEQADGSFKIVVEMTETIGYDQANHATKWMTVIIDKAQDNIPRVRNSFPGKL